MKKFYWTNKQYLRNRISLGASYTEILMSMLILVVVVILSVDVVRDAVSMAIGVFDHNVDVNMSISSFLVSTMELIIAIEFVKMLSKHTLSSIIEVLIFAIARTMIVDHPDMKSVILGVLALAILFFIKKFFTTSKEFYTNDAVIFNGSVTLNELNKDYKINLDNNLGYTVAGVLCNAAKKDNISVRPGYELRVNDYILEVYSMDQDLIKQVRITQESA